MDLIPHILAILVLYQFKEGSGKCYTSKGCPNSACGENQRTACEINAGEQTGHCNCEDKHGECATASGCTRTKCSPNEVPYCHYSGQTKCKCRNRHQCDHDYQCDRCIKRTADRVVLYSGICDATHDRKCKCPGLKVTCKKDKECRDFAGELCDQKLYSSTGVPVCFKDGICGCVETGDGIIQCNSDKDCDKIKSKCDDLNDEREPACINRRCACDEV